MKKNAKDETLALAELLGRVDAVFWPFAGSGDGRNVAGTMGRRQSWLSGAGLPSRASGDATARKNAEQLWVRLESSGLVVVARSNGRRTHARLTRDGEAMIRTLCGTGTVATNWPHFARLVAMFSEMGRASLPESYTANCEPWQGTDEQGRRLTEQRIQLLPFLTADLLWAWHDFRGGNWFSLQPAGRAAFDAGCPERPPRDWEFDQAVADQYDDAFRRETKRLRNASPANPNNLYPPFSAGLGWGNLEQRIRLERELAAKRAQWERRAQEARKERVAEFEGASNPHSRIGDSP